ncbi:MAG: ABC transporter ATP-binding protein [Parcubacteria group bacterium]
MAQKKTTVVKNDLLIMLDLIKIKLRFISELNDLFDRKERWRFILVLAVALLTAFFQAAGVVSILPFINMIMDTNVIHESHWLNYVYQLFNFTSTTSFLVFSGFVVLGLLVVGNFVSALATWLKISFAWKKNHRLSSALLGKYLSMPYVYFLNQNTADLGKNVLTEVQQLTSNFIIPLLSIFTNVVMVIVILALLFYVNFSMTLIAAIVLISLYSSIYYYYSDKLKKGGAMRIEENKKRFKSASEALGGVKDIKILRVEGFFLRRFERASDKFSDLQSWYQVVGQIPRYAMEAIAFGGIVSLLIYLVSSNTPIQKIIPLISFFAFAGYRLMPSIQDIFNSFTIIKFNKAVLDKIHKDMTEGGLVDENDLLKRKEISRIFFNNKIKLKNIFFSYPGSNRNILKDISLEINKNSFVAIIGATGSGKTTLVDLLLGLLSSNSGSFQVDDVEITQDNVKSWQVNLGYVPQQIYLSDDSIARNIAFGLPDSEIDMDQVKKAAHMANIHEFIDKDLEMGYDTAIGERGVRLSGGQRQRIGIARALYYDPEVLIFDEATSSLDNETEKEVLEAINKVAKLKTMIVIAHRLTTVKNCDKVYVVDKGEIIKEGSYREIVDKKEAGQD